MAFGACRDYHGVFVSQGRAVKTVYNYAKMYYKYILIIRRGP